MERSELVALVAGMCSANPATQSPFDALAAAESIVSYAEQNNPPEPTPPAAEGVRGAVGVLRSWAKAATGRASECWPAGAADFNQLADLLEAALAGGAGGMSSAWYADDRGDWRCAKCGTVARKHDLGLECLACKNTPTPGNALAEAVEMLHGVVGRVVRNADGWPPEISSTFSQSAKLWGDLKAAYDVTDTALAKYREGGE